MSRKPRSAEAMRDFAFRLSGARRSGRSVARFAGRRGADPSQRLLHGAGDGAEALLNQRRGLANVRHRSAAVIEDAKVPFQFLTRRFVQLPIRSGVRIRSVLRNLILRTNAVRQLALFSAKSVEFRSGLANAAE